MERLFASELINVGIVKTAFEVTPIQHGRGYRESITEKS